VSPTAFFHATTFSVNMQLLCIDTFELIQLWFGIVRCIRFSLCRCIEYVMYCKDFMLVFCENLRNLLLLAAFSGGYKPICIF